MNIIINASESQITINIGPEQQVLSSKDIAPLIVNFLVKENGCDKTLMNLYHTNRFYRNLTRKYNEEHLVFSDGAIIDSLKNMKEQYFEEFAEAKFLKALDLRLIKKIDISNENLTYYIYEIFNTFLSLIRGEIDIIYSKNQFWRIVDVAHYNKTGGAYTVELDNDLVSGKNNAINTIFGGLDNHYYNREIKQLLNNDFYPAHDFSNIEIMEKFKSNQEILSYTNRNLDTRKVGKSLIHILFANILKERLTTIHFEKIFDRILYNEENINNFRINNKEHKSQTRLFKKITNLLLEFSMDQINDYYD